MDKELPSNKRWRKILIWGGIPLFLVGTAAWGAYQWVVTAEKAPFQVDLTSKQETPVEVDLAKQEWAKKSLDPGRIYIASGQGGIINRGDKPMQLQIELVGIPGRVELSSSDGSFDSESGNFNRLLQPGEGLDLQVRADLPPERLNQHKVFKGAVWFVDRSSGDIVGNLPVRVYNTAIAPTKEELADLDCPMHTSQQ